jgi:hypothetical protein
MANEIDAEKLAAFEALLRKDLERRTIERGDAIHVPLPTIVVSAGEDADTLIEKEKARLTAELRKAGETREVVFDEPLVIFTGVPRGPDRAEKDWAPLSPTNPYDRYSEPRKPAGNNAGKATAEHSEVEAVKRPDEGPHRIIVQVRPPYPERGDHGEVAEGTYTVAGNVVRVEDMEGRSLGGQALRPTDDPKAVARKILREKRAPNDFWGRTLH